MNATETEYIKIPKDRVGALIGKNGQTKKELENSLRIKIKIDSKTGEIELIKPEKTDALNLYLGTKVIKAIGRGFNLEKALLLLNEDYYFELINLKERYGKGSSKIEQIKARIIGTKGKVREEIEETTKAFISVYGNTIGLIGKPNEIEEAKEAIEILLEGGTHKRLFKFLENKNPEAYDGREGS